jgi:DNA-binding GntR family transcriptional regulator
VETSQPVVVGRGERTESAVTADETELARHLARANAQGVPKYVRLQEAVIESIRSGHWKPGDRLPAEEELARFAKMSLGTVQRALRSLSAQGIVVRQQGLGSFVGETQKRMQDPWHCRFLDESTGEILPVYSKAVRRQLVNERGAWSNYLGNGRILRIDRRLDIGGEFNVYSRFYADRGTLGYFWNCPLAELNGANFKKLITRECSLPITDIKHSLRLTTFARDIARIINVGHDVTGMFLFSMAYAGRDTCVYYQEFYIPPTRRFLRFSEGIESNAVLAGRPSQA